MTSKLRSIPTDDVQLLLSSRKVVSRGGILRELLYNSLDARAKHILILVNSHDGSLETRDDGHGITPDDVG